MNPECRAGKHRNCDGKGWRDDLDDIGPCRCSCHEKASDEGGKHATPPVVDCPLTFVEMAHAFYESVHSDDPPEIEQAWGHLLLHYYPKEFETLELFLEMAIAVDGAS